MQEEIYALKDQKSAQKVQQQELIKQLSVLKLQKDTAIAIASLEQMAEHNICPNTAQRAIRVLTQYQKIVECILAQS
ncbi:MAG: hypothetical protein HC862_13245 [Scytonema sp. RU_4_4]|nr:hypothetical protein [Scytonema sp. RU_4_4]